MADFIIVRPEPFVVEGVNGDTYELSRIKDLGADDVAALAEIAEEKDAVTRIKAAKAFILRLCPELAVEPLSDMGYIDLFGALAEGSDVTLGEF